MARSPIAPVGRSIAATELGVLLGFFSQRVIGQYDLLVPEEGDSQGDAVYYVGPNVLGLEKRFAFRPRDFRLWVAIHEVTHRAQFCGIPWMHDYFLELVGSAMGMVDTDPRAIVRSLMRAVGELREGRNPLDEGGLVALLADDEHRDVLGRIQALMSVLEGHGNRVMNELGRVHVAGQERMARVLRARRETAGVTRRPVPDPGARRPRCVNTRSASASSSPWRSRPGRERSTPHGAARSGFPTSTSCRTPAPGWPAFERGEPVPAI